MDGVVGRDTDCGELGERTALRKEDVIIPDLFESIPRSTLSTAEVVRGARFKGDEV